MRTIPPNSRTSIDHPATLFVASTATTVPQGPDHDLTLVAATQTYLACLASGGTPVPDQRLAWDEFYRSFAPVVRRQVRSRGHDRTAMFDDDANQDIWLKVLERLETFRVDAGLGSFPGWLQAVARRRMADRRRVAARRPFPATWDVPPVDHVGFEIDPAVACERAEERTHLDGLLERLRAEVSPINYRVLYLRSIEERSVAEVGRLMGLLPEQVRVRHHRMMRNLRRIAGQPEPPARTRPKKIRKYFHPTRNNIESADVFLL